MTFLVALILLAGTCHFAITTWFGNLDYPNTIQNSIHNITIHSEVYSTGWADIRTNEIIFHAVLEPTCPGSVGSLLTFDGTLDYEYGMFAANFPSDGLYDLQTDTVNTFVVNYIEDAVTFGLYLPRQKTMKWGLLIYPSTAGKELKEEVVQFTTTAIYK